MNMKKDEDAKSCIEVGDSKFLGFVKKINSELDALNFQAYLRLKFPGAAHIPIAWQIPDQNQLNYDDDNEPKNSAGPSLLEALNEICPSQSVAVVVVRFFGHALLGVTCGRLPQCYKATSRLALHRFEHPMKPFEQEYLHIKKSLYGLGAGDTEIILNVVDDPEDNLAQLVLNELEFEGFKGPTGETLPRLQVLQADISSKIIPIYRYPGNYDGDEWQTYPWSKTSLKIKDEVEKKLLPLVHQKMNHCVTNLYWDGQAFIAHHSDKELDIKEDSVIVSVSLGDERVLELKRKKEPQDVLQVLLPHRSMLVLGPKTNKEFSHSILVKERSKDFRISLTLRHVATFMHKPSGRLFGQGTAASDIHEICKADYKELLCLSLPACIAIPALWFVRRMRKRQMDTMPTAVVTGLLCTVPIALRFYFRRSRKNQERQFAKRYFTKTSTNGTKY